MNCQHRLLILGSKDEFAELVEEAMVRGYYTIVCDGYTDGIAKSRANKSYTINIHDTDSIIEMCQYENIDGIITSFSDVLFESATIVAEELNLPWYMKTDQLKYYRSKSAARTLMRCLGINVPDFQILEKGFCFSDLNEITFPVVLKPVNGYGSKGIFVANSIEEIQNYSDMTFGSFECDSIIIEEYIDGYEFNMMCWLIDGQVYVLGIADREKDPLFDNTVPLLNRVIYPSSNINSVYHDAVDIVGRFARSTGQTDGPISMQFFSSHGRLYVCEIAGRLFGYEHELITLCSGLSIESLLLDYLYDKDSLELSLRAHNCYFDKVCAGLYFYALNGQVVCDLDKMIDLAKTPDVLSFSKYYNIGEIVDNHSSRPYFARYYIGSSSRYKVDRITEEFFSSVRVSSSDFENIILPHIMEHRVDLADLYAN